MAHHCRASSYANAAETWRQLTGKAGCVSEVEKLSFQEGRTAETTLRRRAWCSGDETLGRGSCAVLAGASRRVRRYEAHDDFMFRRCAAGFESQSDFLVFLGYGQVSYVRKTDRRRIVMSATAISAIVQQVKSTRTLRSEYRRCVRICLP